LSHSAQSSDARAPTRTRPAGRGAPGSHRRLVIHVDGGSRGNPGPAAIGVVVATADGEVIEELAEPIGHATNNVAEYRALLRGLERAAALGAREVDLINDSQLVSRQLTGAYRVKHPAMAPLHAKAQAALAGFERWQIRSVPRARNAHADALVNRALDGSV
jgi:ribonuclease HI